MLAQASAYSLSLALSHINTHTLSHIAPSPLPRACALSELLFSPLTPPNLSLSLSSYLLGYFGSIAYAVLLTVSADKMGDTQGGDRCSCTCDLCLLSFCFTLTVIFHVYRWFLLLTFGVRFVCPYPPLTSQQWTHHFLFFLT